MSDFKLLKEITQLNGIAANEVRIRQYLYKKFVEIVGSDNISYDGLGSIIAKKVGDVNGPKIMLAGHMDEIGMIVTKITPEGFIKFQPIGGWTNGVLLAQQFTITTSDGKEYIAVMGSTPPHLLTEEQRKKPVEITDMYMDLGVKDKKEVEQLNIKIGDMITPLIETTRMANKKYLLGKAWDDRVGCAIIVEVIKRLQDEKHPNIVYGVGTTQEEVGCRGAKTSANHIKPDIGIALDVTIARDLPDTPMDLKMGDGPSLLVYDSSLVGHVGLRKEIVKICDEMKLPYQLDYLRRGGTDASSIALSSGGVPSMAICIPTRYIHSHTSIIHEDDYENTINLIVELIKKFDNVLVNKIKYE